MFSLFPNLLPQGERGSCFPFSLTLSSLPRKRESRSGNTRGLLDSHIRGNDDEVHSTSLLQAKARLIVGR